MERSIYIVADYFPPMSAVGIHRTLALCRHLVERRWQVTVISARPTGKEALDYGLLKQVPPEVRVLRAPSPDIVSLAGRMLRGKGRGEKPAREANPEGISGEAAPAPFRNLWRQWANWLSWWFHVPDHRAAWILPAVLMALKQPRRGKVDIVFSSAPMWSSHVVGAMLARALRAPLVADFRDPWCGSAWRDIPWKTHQFADQRMERFVVSASSQITCAWEGIRRHLAGRYPDRCNSMHTILNGFNPAEVDAIEPVRVDPKCVLLHVGTFYGHRSPLPLLGALRHLRQETPQEADGLKVVQMGSPVYDGRPIEDLAREYGVAEQVRVLPARPHHQALAALKGADVAMLFGQSGNEQLSSIPAKAYEYIGAGKAVLAIGAGEEVLNVLSRGGCRVWAGEGNDSARLAGTLRQILRRHREKDLASATPTPARMEFTQSRMAQRLEKVFLGVLNKR